jgi:hypothetical protein
MIFPQWNLIKIYYSFFSNVDMILPNLWLGNYHAALDHDFISKNNIDIIVNCTPDIPFISDHSIKKIRIPVYDSQLEKDFILMEYYLKIIIPILHKAYVENKKILICCYAGKQRSAIVVASLLYYMTTTPITKSFILHHLNHLDDNNKSSLIDSIFSFIIQKRPQAFTYGFRINFKPSFERLYNKITSP